MEFSSAVTLPKSILFELIEAASSPASIERALCLRPLLLNEVDVTTGEIPIVRACRKGALEAAAVLLSWGKLAHSTNTTSGESLLHLAATAAAQNPDLGLDSAALCMLLAIRGAEIDAVDMAGRTPLHAACSTQPPQMKTAAILLKV